MRNPKGIYQNIFLRLMEVGKAITCYWNRNHFEILLDFRFQVALKRVFHFYNSELSLCMTLTLSYQDGVAFTGLYILDILQWLVSFFSLVPLLHWRTLKVKPCRSPIWASLAGGWQWT